MTIDILSNDMILVSLLTEDMTRYELDFGDGADTSATRRGLTRLMYRVGEECALDHAEKSYLVEALPGRDGCLLIISVRGIHKRKKYRIRHAVKCTVCRFDTADDMLELLARCDRIAGLSYRLYELNGRYYLMTDEQPPKAAAAMLNEYATVCELSLVAAARLCEHGHRLIRHRPRPRHHGYSCIAAR